jgi:hypothetical protein
MECAGHMKHFFAGGGNQRLAPYRRPLLCPFCRSQTNQDTDIFSLDTIAIYWSVYSSPQLRLHSRDSRHTPNYMLPPPPQFTHSGSKGSPVTLGSGKKLLPLFFIVTRQPDPPVPVPFVYCNPHNSRRQCYRHRELVPPSNVLEARTLWSC